MLPNTARAVDFPIPFVPTSPNTYPGRGVGILWSLKEFFPYLCVISFVISLGRLIILIALKGHLLTHRPHPIQRISEISTLIEVGSTWIQSFPDLLIGQAFLHSSLQFFGLHLSLLIIAILSLLSYME